MKINRNNYEIYFIDYFDGKLFPAERKELHAFLEANPDLKAELSEFENITLPKQKNINFSKKENLKKQEINSSGPVHESNYEDYFIASYEGDLSSEEKEHLKTFLKKNTFLEKEYKQFGKVFIKADDSIIYDKKDKLKKYPFAYQKTLYYTVGIAASLALLFGSLFLFWGEIFKPAKHPLANVIQMQRIENREDISLQDNEKTYILEQKEVPRNFFLSLPLDPDERQYITRLEKKSSEGVIDIFNVSGIENELIDMRFNDIRTRMSENENIFLAENMANKEKTLVGKILQNSFNKLKSVFKSGKKEDEEKSQGLNLWNIAEAGIEGFNFLTDKNIRLQRVVNEKGETVSYALLGNNLNYKKKLKK